MGFCLGIVFVVLNDPGRSLSVHIMHTALVDGKDIFYFSSSYKHIVITIKIKEGNYTRTRELMPGRNRI